MISNFVFPSRLPVPETETNDSAASEYDDLYDLIMPRVINNNIENTADLVFAVDTFSNLIGDNDKEDDSYVNNSDDMIEEKEMLNCYTHTVMLLGQCVVMCDNTIVRFCDNSL